MPRLFSKRFPKPKPSKVQTVTLNGFSGGWNSVDDDISMAARFMKVCTNTYRTPSGGQAVRFGTRFFTDIKPAHNSPIVDTFYYNGKMVVVTTDGWVLTVDAVGTVAIIWSPAISATRVGSPTIWNPNTTQVSFVSFKDKLAIHNGKDKPLQIDSSFVVNYLQDAGSGSNVNVPIGQYGCTAGNFHCVAGIPNLPTTVYIAAQGTIGTFPGDAAPNDSISIDVGAYAPEGAAEIRGLSGYRTFLIVHMQGISIQVKLGNYDASGNHKPEFPDTFPKFGLVGNRCKAVIENDLVFAGIAGLSSAKRNVFSGNLDSDYLSSKVENEYRRIVGSLSNTQQLISSFSVYDPLSNSFITTLPAGEHLVYTSNSKQHYSSWSKFTGWDWTCGCATFLGRVYFAKGTKIFQYGNKTFGETYSADREMDRDANWQINTAFVVDELVYDIVGDKVYKCRVSHTSTNATFAIDRTAFPAYWEEYLGIPIEFEMEQPWFSGREPMQLKMLRYLSLATKGSGPFTVEAYVDNLFKDEDGEWLINQDGSQINPQLSMDFVGNDALGFGFDGVFGGGRRSRDPRLWKFPTKFKSVKFRIKGSTTRALEFINMSFLFVRGKYTR
jgi:hypothetical protein